MILADHTSLCLAQRIPFSFLGDPTHIPYYTHIPYPSIFDIPQLMSNHVKYHGSAGVT
jgi:hypothetical protein